LLAHGAEKIQFPLDFAQPGFQASIAWLRAERDNPSCAAARVKLRSRATATKA